jgi:phosphoglycolate phosphatase
LPHAGPREQAAFLADYEENAVVLTAPYPGIVAALQRLQAAGHPLAVCTNKPEAVARMILEGLGLARFFTAVTGGDSTPFRKPDARHLAATLALLGVERAAMVGDHDNDMAAARGLGINSIFAAWGYGEAVGTLMADSPGALPDLISGLG